MVTDVMPPEAHFCESPSCQYRPTCAGWAEEGMHYDSREEEFLRMEERSYEEDRAFAEIDFARALRVERLEGEAIRFEETQEAWALVRLYGERRWYGLGNDCN